MRLAEAPLPGGLGAVVEVGAGGGMRVVVPARSGIVLRPAR
jgi:hypothetical protein